MHVRARRSPICDAGTLEWRTWAPPVRRSARGLRERIRTHRLLRMRLLRPWASRVRESSARPSLVRTSTRAIRERSSATVSVASASERRDTSARTRAKRMRAAKRSTHTSVRTVPRVRRAASCDRTDSSVSSRSWRGRRAPSLWGPPLRQGTLLAHVHDCPRRRVNNLISQGVPHISTTPSKRARASGIPVRLRTCSAERGRHAHTRAHALQERTAAASVTPSVAAAHSASAA